MRIAVARVTLAEMSSQRSLLGRPLETRCETDENDKGRHVVCVQLTAEFLAFSKSRGNDLSTPRPGFAGLRPGDRWCVCAARWQEALLAGVAPPVYLAGTHEQATEICDREELMRHALDAHNLN